MLPHSRYELLWDVGSPGAFWGGIGHKLGVCSLTLLQPKPEQMGCCDDSSMTGRKRRITGGKGAGKSSKEGFKAGSRQGALGLLTAKDF